MNPFRHGEVFVLDDGTEDMDFGTYERFLNQSISEKTVHWRKIISKIIEKKDAEIT